MPMTYGIIMYDMNFVFSQFMSIYVYSYSSVSPIHTAVWRAVCTHPSAVVVS